MEQTVHWGINDAARAEKSFFWLFLVEQAVSRNSSGEADPFEGPGNFGTRWTRYSPDPLPLLPGYTAWLYFPASFAVRVVMWLSSANGTWAEVMSPCFWPSSCSPPTSFHSLSPSSGWWIGDLVLEEVGAMRRKQLGSLNDHMDGRSPQTRNAGQTSCEKTEPCMKLSHWDLWGCFCK